MARAAIKDVAQRLGFTYRLAAEPSFCRQFFDLPSIRASSTARDVMHGALDGRPLTIFTASYTIHTGHVTVPVTHTVYAVEAAAWPIVLVAPRSLSGQVAHRLGWRRGLILDDPRFSTCFHVTGADDDFTITLLGPEMQDYLLTKRSVRWYVGGGRVCLIYGGAIRADRVEQSLERLRGFFARIPPELEAW